MVAGVDNCRLGLFGRPLLAISLTREARKKRWRVTLFFFVPLGPAKQDRSTGICSEVFLNVLHPAINLLEYVTKR